MESGVSRQMPAGSLDDSRIRNESTNVLLGKKKVYFSSRRQNFSLRYFPMISDSVL